jgi:hypothetical protein
VEKLTNQEDLLWKEDLVRHIFMPHDVEEYSKFAYQDLKRVTSFLDPQKHGMFTVNVYNLVLDL